jgi:hypothetical protein
MACWEKLMTPGLKDWLLDRENPSIRYFALRDIADCPETDTDVVNAKQAIMQSAPVQRILAKQTEGGYWGKPEDFYEHSKYKGTVWNIILLAELGTDASDKRVRAAGEFILQAGRDRQSGGYAHISDLISDGGKHDAVIPCLTGNMLWSLIRFGLLHDPRVQDGIDWIAICQRFDDKDTKPPREFPYTVRYQCWGRHTCMMGAVKALRALAEIPIKERSPQVMATLETGAEFLLKHHLYKRSHNLDKIAKPDWLKLGFPTMWHTHVLEMLDILTALDCRDERMQEAVDLVLSKRDEQGRWPMELSYNKRMLVSFENEGEPSKWITLQALRALKRLDWGG